MWQKIKEFSSWFFKKTRRALGWILGALVVGPIVGILAAIVYDPTMPIPINIILPTVIGFGAMMGLIGFPLTVAAIFCGILGLIGIFFYHKECADRNAQRLENEIAKNEAKPAPTAENPHPTAPVVNKEDVEKYIDKLISPHQEAPQQHTPIGSGLYFGFKAANAVSKFIAGTDASNAEYGRIYNLSDRSTTQTVIRGADGYVNHRSDPPPPPPNPIEANGNAAPVVPDHNP